jgi:lipase chaperone LimK
VARRVERPPVDLARQLPGRKTSDIGDHLPRSLRDTDTDGWIGTDDAGQLVVTPGARWFFDYFLSAAGEEPDEEIRARIVAEIEKRLAPTAARQAIDLLDRYLTYRDEVRGLQESEPSDDLAQRLADLHRIRIETFGDADAAALFGEEEQVQSVDLRRRALANDQTLSPQERQQRIDELEQELPAQVRQARDTAMAAARLSRDEQQLRDAGGTPEEIHALREERFGAAAADRLAALDRERAEWQQRLDDYRRDRQSIASDAALDDSARARALDALLVERFTPRERVRVEALVNMGDPKP